MQTGTEGNLPPPRHDREDQITELAEAVAIPQDETWRLEMFLNLGIDRREAQWMALAKVDWQKARDMVENGCPPSLVPEILL